ncbi:hypothetical protein A11A3_09842, partial [Alcanivorax hongdengensis A-11-3]
HVDTVFFSPYLAALALPSDKRCLAGASLVRRRRPEGMTSMLVTQVGHRQALKYRKAVPKGGGFFGLRIR